MLTRTLARLVCLGMLVAVCAVQAQTTPPSATEPRFSRLIIKLRSLPGGALVTLTKPEDLFLTLEARQRDGRPVAVLDPFNAAPGTIRKDFAESIEANSVHGSDSAENAAREIAFFFSEIEIAG